MVWENSELQHLSDILSQMFYNNLIHNSTLFISCDDFKNYLESSHSETILAD
ncbi:hypothetical protein VTN02DRAFT_871 [Thermoascus thermophilus]